MHLVYLWNTTEELVFQEPLRMTQSGALFSHFYLFALISPC